MKDPKKESHPKGKTPSDVHPGGKPSSGPDLTAEQTREAHEAEVARNAEASIRDRMVEIGRATRQSGRQRQDT